MRCDEVLRKAGDRGGVPPPVPCKELRDARLCSVGVVERSLPPRELELGALRRGDFVEWLRPEGEEVPWRSREAMGEAAGNEGGRTVAAAVESERRFMSSRSMAPSLFVD